MSELTQQYFDKRLNEQTAELKSYAREQTEELARIVAAGFDDLKRELDVRDRVHQLETDMRQIKEALHISA
jgi:hypothetical protein